MDPGAGGTTDPTMNGNTGGTGGVLPPGGLGVPMVSVSGQVLDFDTLMPLAGATSVAASGVSPVPAVSMNGADFVLTNVQPYSVFYLIASSPPDYRSTYNAPVSVSASDVTGAQELAVKESTLSSFATAFKVTQTSGTAVLMVRTVDGSGMPLAKVPASAFGMSGTNGAQGPFFLDDKKQPDPMLTATSSSGWAILFNVPPGSVEFSAPAASGLTLTSPAAPVSANLVTVADVIVQQAGMAPTPPTNVSFATQIVPIFMRRGCVNCHSGNGPGRDLGGLTLDGSIVIDYRNVVTNISPNFGTTRVDLKNPANSLVLTMPGYENPPDKHPTVVFATTMDPDYLLLLSWIKAGAPNN